MSASKKTSIAGRIIAELRRSGNPEKSHQMASYFKAGKGEYGEGDRFLGVTVPMQRAIASKFRKMADEKLVAELLQSAFHEVRLTGVFLLVHLFQDGMKKGAGETWVNLYLSLTDRINNWDLVDSSAYKILGEWLLDKDRSVIYQLARSKNLWENRIAMIATLAFIRKGDIRDTMKLAGILKIHSHDLMHKAVGWMLREAWLREPAVVEGFLQKHLTVLPKVLLRYTIEKMPEAKRVKYLQNKEKKKSI